MKLMVAVPISWERVYTEFFISYAGLFRPQQIIALAEEGVEVDTTSGKSPLLQVFGTRFPLDLNRNFMVQGALVKNYDALIFLDADMTFPVDTLVRLVRQFKANPRAGIITGLYFKKAFPYLPVPANWLINRPQNMFPIRCEQPLETADVVGMGCAIIRLEAVKALPQPWFEYRRDFAGGENGITEDVAFCIKMKAAGWQILCDNGLVCDHLTTMKVGVENYRHGLSEIQRQRAIQEGIEAAALRESK
jgi:hypothetical protein